MATPFAGFGKNATKWYKGLAEDNSKAYFDRNRARFDGEIRGPLEDLLTELAAEYGGDIKIFRQNRDIRFSADKSPYKLNTYGVVSNATKLPGGLYVSVAASGFYAGTGYYQMAPDQLERYRTAVDDERSGKRLERIVEEIEAAGLEVSGAALKTVPRGYPKDHPRARLLAMKDLIVGKQLPAGAALTDRRAYDHAVETWRTAAPLLKWLDSKVGGSTIPPEQRSGRR